MHLEVAAMGGTTQAFSSRDLVMYNVEVHARSNESKSRKGIKYVRLWICHFVRIRKS